MSEHPLYPKEEEFISISLYEPKPCMKCNNFDRTVMWRDITCTESMSIIDGPRLIQEYMRVCDRCAERLSGFEFWS